ncbi:transcription termination factor Rho [Austwickia chelonae]|uniref:transcription termination factor Rho n=1 Tax=Austwickia chelonae TaxID=100225 RepID=UPI000E269B9D|nr:transcription termination factor Rho [Austwickia chelonae]
MTDTTELSTPADEAPKRRGLTTLRLAELQNLAQAMGISGTSGMRKGDLILAIKERQGGASTIDVQVAAPRRAGKVQSSSVPERKSASQEGEQRSTPSEKTTKDAEPVVKRSAGEERSAPSAQDETNSVGTGRQRRSRRATAPVAAPERREEGAPAPAEQEKTTSRTEQADDRQQSSGNNESTQNNDEGQGRRRSRRERQRDSRQSGDQGADSGQSRGESRGDSRGESSQGSGRQGESRRFGEDDDSRGGRRRNRQRSRDRKRRGNRGMGDDYSDQMETFTEDDVLVPIAGILDVLDNYAFVRTSGYLPGPNDVYVPLGIVKKNGLRKGDAVTGAVKALREGEQLPARQKFNALVRLDTVNGGSPDSARGRVEFNKLTPLYPQERLRLETEPNIYTTRIIDLVSPIGKGQRGLIVSPPKAGKTLILQAIANAITKNNPEAHLMVVLVDERPEEVTDMQRTVKGEVIASTFDRPADDHTTVAELAIERAKRLVEMGHDVVVLLDSITRLGRAYNLAAPASGRILSGGVDSSALYPPKRFFGAARNIENGGSLTILATALVETGSKMDEVIFEEFKGTGNMELRLSRQLADRRIFPAVDVNPSGTRREEILMSADELKLMWKLRRILSALESQAALELLLAQMKKTKQNAEFLMMVQRNSSIKLDDED